MIAGAAPMQASPSGADSGLVAGQGGDNNLQSNADQQSQRSSQLQSSELRSSQQLSDQSSQPASAQQISGDKEPEGASSAASAALKHQGSAQETLAQSTPPPGQAMSSEELTSNEKRPLQRESLQSVEGSRGHDAGAEAGMASSSRDMSALVEQDASSDEELSEASGSEPSGRGQSIDETEDTTTRMLESAGKSLHCTPLNVDGISLWICKRLELDHGHNSCRQDGRDVCLLCC